MPVYSSQQFYFDAVTWAAPACGVPVAAFPFPGWAVVVSPGVVVEPGVAPVVIFAFVDSLFLFAVVVLFADALVSFFPVPVVFQSVAAAAAAAFVSVVAVYLFQLAGLQISFEIVVLQASLTVISDWTPGCLVDVPASFFPVAVAFQSVVDAFLFQLAGLSISFEVVVLQGSLTVISDLAPGCLVDVPASFFPLAVAFQSVVDAFLFQLAALPISFEVVVLQGSLTVVSDWTPGFYLDVPASFFQIAVAFQFPAAAFEFVVAQVSQVGMSPRAVAAC